MEEEIITPQKKSWKIFQTRKGIALLIIIGILVAGSASSYFIFKHKLSSDNSASISSAQNKDIYVQFLSEIWDTIKTSHWEKQQDDALANLYKLGTEKVIGKPVDVTPKTKEDVQAMTELAMKDMDATKKKEFATSLSDIVLANLKPFGRSRLFGQKQQEDLKNTVENRDPNADLYATLDVEKDATKEEIDKKYTEKVKTVDATKPEGKQELAKLERAKNALASPDARKAYDEIGVEPTVITKLIKPDIFYMHITKVSPQTFDEFQKAANSTDKQNLKLLIIDLRGNIGGAVDILPYFLGPFIGPDNYAYDFFHQGEYTPYKTKIGWMPSLVKFKKVVVLIDGESQSSAEIMAATFKKYNVGIVVGTHTKGWGTIEQLMPVKTVLDSKESYSILMVHSLTLRDDGQPVEGKGVDPLINITDKDWDKQLMEYVSSSNLVEAVKGFIKK